MTTMPQTDKKPLPPSYYGWCYNCHMPARTSLCSNCTFQLTSSHKSPYLSAPKPAPPKSIDMGPLPTPPSRPLPQTPRPLPPQPAKQIIPLAPSHKCGPRFQPNQGGQYRCPLPRESSQNWKPSQSHRPLTSNDVNQPLLCNLLLDAESFYDNDHKCTRYEWTGTLKDNDVAAIVDWMKKHGATQPSSILPYYWCIENQYLKLSICSHPKGNTYITLLDLSKGSNLPVAQSSNKTESEVRA